MLDLSRKEVGNSKFALMHYLEIKLGKSVIASVKARSSKI